MKIKEYVSIVKDLQKEGLSENIICKILEEHGKDLRTENMEKGKNERVGLVEPKQFPKKTEKTPKDSQKQESKGKDKGNYGKPTDKMIYVLEKTWEAEDGKEFLKECDFDGNFDDLSFEKARMLIKLIKDKQKEEFY